LGRLRRRRHHVRLRRYAQPEFNPDFDVTQQEGPLVEPLSPEPAGDFVVALAGVAGGAGRHDVVEGVSPSTGECEYAVALQRLVRRAAVRAATPSSSERGPLLGGEVVHNPSHAAFPSAGGPGLPTSADRHSSSVRSAHPAVGDADPTPTVRRGWANPSSHRPCRFLHDDVRHDPGSSAALRVTKLTERAGRPEAPWLRSGPVSQSPR
jgi:hypothetical protein